MSSWDPGTPLRGWLRKKEQPARIRVRDVDDAEKLVELSPNPRNRWKAAEEAIFALDAVTVECLDANGNVLRATRLRSEDDEDQDHDDRRGRRELAAGGEYMARALAKAKADTTAQNAAMLDAFGRWMTQAHEQGSSAASVGQDNLVLLVKTLTENLGQAIVNLHNVSVNMISYMQDAAEAVSGGGGSTNDDLLKGILGKALGADDAPTNGKGRRAVE